MSLPKWVDEIDYSQRYPYVNNLTKALSIAMETLEHFQFYSGRTVYDYENEANEALRRIEELDHG